MILQGGIRLRFLIPLVGLIILLMVSSSAIFIRHEAASLEKQLTRKQKLLENKMDEKAASLTANLILVIERAVVQYDLTYIRTVVEQGAKEISELAHLSVTDQLGVVLFSSDPKMLGEKLTFSGNQVVHKTPWQGQSVLELHRPIQSAGDAWGTIVLALTFDALDREITQSRIDMDRNIQQIWQFAWLMGTLFTILGVIVVVLTVRHVTAPLLALTKAVGRITRNVAGTEIPTFPGRGEIALLSHGFQQMLNRIRAYLDELQEVNLSLERKVQERTQDLVKKAGELEIANRNIIDSIHYAKNIQNAILPKEEQIRQALPDHFVVWQPKDIVGGDFHWFRPSRDRSGCLVAVADCTGHGVPGSLITMTAHSILREIVTGENFEDPALILKALNHAMRKALGQDKADAASNDGLDIGLCYLNTKQDRLIFAGARQPLYYIMDGQIYTIKGDRHSIGYKESDPNFTFQNHVVEMSTETQFYLTTDGFYDQCGGEKTFPFGTSRFKALMEECYQKPNPEQGAFFMSALQNYQKSMPQMDDITLFGFRIRRHRGE